MLWKLRSGTTNFSPKSTALWKTLWRMWKNHCYSQDFFQSPCPIEPGGKGEKIQPSWDVFSVMSFQATAGIIREIPGKKLAFSERKRIPAIREENRRGKLCENGTKG